MKTVTIRDLRTRPRQVREALGGETEAVLTANGRPVAILVPTDASTIDQTLDLLRRARGIEALRALRDASRRRGTHRLSSAAVNEVTARVRRARRARRP
jgi:antitoxin (DNA-binding transcriptional repressor) of toxin-antitoxin stability system